MGRFSVVAVLGLVAATAVAPAGAQDVTDQAAQQEKKICRSEKMTGSLTRRIRTCMTQAEWDRQAEGTQRNTDRFSRDVNRAYANDCQSRPGGCY
ncbi:MAG: hypothetical protein B7Z08_13195 [Sphingomonadales bacterium 32-68-7]|nr:MAG: hypothetical protein B7Z33_02810 [Sphingomonadales bacterium 12-68-11]OYX06956.1 MAG: hypothetical protein B7Z08_13195 [Sphingomonadales bacterium 32-68-7]